MTRTIQLQTRQGEKVAFVDKIIGSGAMKDVFFAPDRSYVVALFRERLDADARERLRSICEDYRQGIYGQAGGAYWHEVFCWPSGVVEHEGRIGVVAPTYPPYSFRARFG